MADDAQPLHVRRETSIHAQEVDLSTSKDKTFKQAMTSLNIAQYSPEDKLAQMRQIYDLYQEDQVTISEDGTPVIKLHERFAHIYCNPTARAAMANPEDVAQTDLV